MSQGGEGHRLSGRGSPAPGGREGLKEIVRGRDGGRSEGKERHRRRVNEAKAEEREASEIKETGLCERSRAAGATADLRGGGGSARFGVQDR